MRSQLISFFICFVLVFCFSNVGFSQYLEDGVKKETTITERILPKEFSSEKKCPVYADTQMSDVNRHGWEISFRFNAVDMPTNGKPRFTIDNYDVGITHNLSNQLFVHLYVGSRKTVKDDYIDNIYEPEFESRLLVLYGGIYVTPVLKIFGGAGRFFNVQNEEGDQPELNSIMEYGIGYDIPAFGNKIEISVKNIEAGLVDAENKSATEATGDQSYTTFAISYHVGFDWN